MRDFQIIVLAAGLQRRFEAECSKMMVPLGDRYNIDFLLESCRSVVENSQITVVVSDLFLALEKHLLDAYKGINIIRDPYPGKGTLRSLSWVLPCKTRRSVVTDGDIYFEPSLIKSLANREEPTFVVTDKPWIIPTHRGISVSPFTIPEHGTTLDLQATYRNLGAHLWTQEMFSLVSSCDANDIIDFIRWTWVSGKVQYHPLIYSGTFLHMASVDDVSSWSVLSGAINA